MINAYSFFRDTKVPLKIIIVPPINIEIFNVSLKMATPIIEAKNSWKYVNGCKELASAISYALVSKKCPDIPAQHSSKRIPKSENKIGS